MSRLQEGEFDAVKSRLSSHAGESIFGRGSSQNWVRAYQNSYDYSEDSEWPTLSSLRSRVRKRIGDELPLVSEREEALLKRLLLFGGTSPLFNDEEAAAAESLTKRLWCTCVIRDNGQIFIRLADVLIKPVLTAAVSDGFQEKRAKVYALTATLRSMVYLHGMLYAEPAVAHLTERMMPAHDQSQTDLIYRYLKAEFDFCRDQQGNLVLMHPGLIYPERMLAAISNASYQSNDYTREMIIGGMSEQLKEEAAAEDILRSELGFALQPGYNAGIMVNDIKFLIKQGATHEQLSALISDKLAVQMTPRIEDALRRAEVETVRWQSNASRRLN